MVSQLYPADPGSSDSMANERQLVIVRLMYFFFFVGNGIFSTFIALYYHEIGLSGPQLGTIFSLGPLIGMVAVPLWGVLSDRLGKVRLLLMVTGFGVIVATFGLSLSREFLFLLPVAAFFAFFSRPIDSLMSGVTLSLLGDRPERYGRQRIWGSIGYIFSSGIGGFLLQFINLAWMFYVQIGAMSVFVLASQLLRPQPVRVSRPVWHGIKHLVQQHEWALFMASIFVLSLANNGMYTFLSPYLKDMGGSESLIGTVWSLGAVAELPILFFGTVLLTRFGPRKLLLFAYAVYAVRWFLYGIMPSAQWALAINLMHGITLGPFLIAGVDYANRLAPPDLKITSQGMVITASALASIVGSPISGYLYDQIGPASLFQIYALIGLLAFLLLWLGSRITGRP
ncbi:MAG: MFS transporter [Anaerolineae bacterium]|nr:MFS transporter [Anaerolineae bacterium]